MLLTPNLALKKPEGTDVVDIADLNANADILDAAIGAATSAATVSTLMKRDAAGRAKVVAPAVADDIARKDTVDAHANRTDNPHATTAAQVGAIPTTQKGTANGVASLDAGGKVPSTQLPTTAASPRTATLVVAASNSSAAGKASADYVCTGSGDHTTINNALNALPATGGKVVLLEGTYSIFSDLLVKSNCTLEGQGDSTILTVPNARNTTFNFIANADTTNGNSGICISNMKIDGNRANQTSGTNGGVSFTKVSNSTIQNVKAVNLTGNGLNMSGSFNCLIVGNACQNNASYGITIASSSLYIKIIGNLSHGNTFYGIYLSSSSFNTVTGNSCQGNGVHGIYINNSSNNNVSSNTCAENSQTTHNASDNICLGGTSSTNSVQGNTCRQGALTNKPRYGIRVDASTCNGNMITNNDITTGGATGAFSDVGTGTITTAGNKLA